MPAAPAADLIREQMKAFFTAPTTSSPIQFATHRKIPLPNPTGRMHMKLNPWIFVACMAFAPLSASARQAPIDAALARANALETEMKFAEEVETLRPFADSGNAKVEYALAFAYMELAIDGQKPGEISADAIRPAIDFAQRAVTHGGANGNNLLALIYSNGWGVPVDSAKGADYLRRGFEAGDTGAKLNYAIALYVGAPGIPRDVDRACPMLFDLISGANPDVTAAYYVGLIRFRGQCGRKADKVAGVNIIKIAADHGVRDAERDMGRNFEFGWAGPVDLPKALDWYRKASEHGDPHSEWRIGMAYVNGELGPKDSVKGVEYLERAAASDDGDGLVDLGVMYVTGDGVAKDFAKAKALYERAVALGQSHAYRELAAMYANGEGVAIDLVRARLMYLQSVEIGEPESARIRAYIEAKLDAAQMKESDRQFGEWKQKRAAQ